jgi:hypothetical protein
MSRPNRNAVAPVLQHDKINIILSEGAKIIAGDYFPWLVNARNVSVMNLKVICIRITQLALQPAAPNRNLTCYPVGVRKNIHVY